MPLYDYQCERCGHRFEQRQSILDEPLTECQQCSGPVKRLISGGAGFIMNTDSYHDGNRKHGSACSLEKTGQTCCGRQERCESPHCGN